MGDTIAGDGMMGGMMWGMGLVGLLGLVLVSLGIVALAKYAFSDRR